MELKKGQNMLEHEAEIFSRPARTWFQTEKEKARAAGDALSWLRLTHGLTGGTRHVIGRKQGGNGIAPGESGGDSLKVRPKRDKYAGLSRKVKRRKMAIEAEQEPGQKGAIDAAIRSAKRQARPGKVGKVQTKNAAGGRKKVASKVTSRVGDAFNQDLSAKREGIRARKGDAIGGMGRRKGGKR